MLLKKRRKYNFKDIDEKILDNEKEELYYFIKLFVKRNKYYDEKYAR